VWYRGYDSSKSPLNAKEIEKKHLDDTFFGTRDGLEDIEVSDGPDNSDDEDDDEDHPCPPKLSSLQRNRLSLFHVSLPKLLACR
jgi:hypothetical protein